MSLLERHAFGSIQTQIILSPPTIEFINGLECEVKAILDANNIHDRLYCLVDWLSFLLILSSIPNHVSPNPPLVELVDMQFTKVVCDFGP